MPFALVVAISVLYLHALWDVLVYSGAYDWARNKLVVAGNTVRFALIRALAPMDYPLARIQEIEFDQENNDDDDEEEEQKPQIAVRALLVEGPKEMTLNEFFHYSGGGQKALPLMQMSALLSALESEGAWNDYEEDEVLLLQPVSHFVKSLWALPGSPAAPGRRCAVLAYRDLNDPAFTRAVILHEHMHRALFAMPFLRHARRPALPARAFVRFLFRLQPDQLHCLRTVLQSFEVDYVKPTLNDPVLWALVTQEVTDEASVWFPHPELQTDYVGAASFPFLCMVERAKPLVACVAGFLREARSLVHIELAMHGRVFRIDESGTSLIALEQEPHTEYAMYLKGKSHGLVPPRGYYAMVETK